MALTTPINTSKVRTELSESSNKVGDLCRSDKINKWSKWKPVRFPKVTPMTLEDMKSVSFGLDYNGNYNKPLGGASSPCLELSDFRGYYHNAYPPVYVQIISVNGQTTPPYNIFPKGVCR